MLLPRPSAFEAVLPTLLLVTCRKINTNTCSMTISLIFLRVYIEFQKLLGNDDQNNIEHLHSVIKKRKEICHFTYRFQAVLLYPF